MNLVNLVELDLYDNQLTEITGLNSLVNLLTLDLSYNRIEKIQSKLFLCFVFQKFVMFSQQ